MSTTVPLPTPEPGRSAAEAFVASHLDHLAVEPVVAGSERFRGGQGAADAALAALDVAGYARRRNEVAPETRRGATMLSPYIRHGLIQLGDAWAAVAGAPDRDAQKFRDELLWQEFARHWYAQLGVATRDGVRRELPVRSRPSPAWDRSMACIDLVVRELERDGWLVNQTRMWLAGHWTVRLGHRWRDGEDEFFRHLLDGSRAANRLGWQWTSGVGSSKPYGFSRWQVEKRAPGLCRSCPHAADCPIAAWPDDPDYVAGGAIDDGGAATRIGPTSIESSGVTPEAVWITAESLGDRDPAMRAHPELPVVFVFDEPLLRALKLSSKRLVFLVETLAELAALRRVEVHLGRPIEALDGRAVAVTHAPVPGFVRHAATVGPVETHPWPWLVPARPGGVSSFSAWRKRVRAPSTRR